MASGFVAFLFVGIAEEIGVRGLFFRVLEQSLVFVSALHWAWNFFEGPIFGTAVSGHAGASLLKTTTAGADAWTGGEFGPEASLVAVLVCGAVTVAVVLLAMKRGQVRPPSWRRAVTQGAPGPADPGG